MEKESAFSKPTIILHWTVAVLFIGLIVVGFYMGEMPKGPEKGQIVGLHKSFGAIFLLLAIGRIVWRKIEGALPMEPSMPRIQQIIAKSVMHLLMLFTLVMPITGIMMSVGAGYGLNVFGIEIIAKADKIGWMREIGHYVHTALPWVLVLIIALHLLGALKHHFINKDNTLKKMLGMKS